MGVKVGDMVALKSGLLIKFQYDLHTKGRVQKVEGRVVTLLPPNPWNAPGPAKVELRKLKVVKRAPG